MIRMNMDKVYAAKDSRYKMICCFKFQEKFGEKLNGTILV